MTWIMCSSNLKNFVSQYATLGWQGSSFQKYISTIGSPIDIFYNRILKIARQCEFPDMDDCIINAIIFGTNCGKAQDKLL